MLETPAFVSDSQLEIRLTYKLINYTIGQDALARLTHIKR
jgi:hypothetical protein